MRAASRILAGLGAIALVGSMAACSSDPKVTPKPPGQHKTLTGGTSTVVLDRGFVSQLNGLKLTPSAYGTAKVAKVGGDTEAVLPITSGDLRLESGGTVLGTVDHNGSGLTFTSGTADVTVQKFVINAGQTSTITAEVDLNGSVAFKSLTIFDLDTSTQQAKASGSGVDLVGAKIYLSKDAATDLNAALNTTALAGGRKVLIGTLTVKGT